jgi:hypothetical protein
MEQDDEKKHRRAQRIQGVKAIGQAGAGFC